MYWQLIFGYWLLVVVPAIIFLAIALFLPNGISTVQHIARSKGKTIAGCWLSALLIILSFWFTSLHADRATVRVMHYQNPPCDCGDADRVFHEKRREFFRQFASEPFDKLPFRHSRVLKLSRGATPLSEGEEVLWAGYPPSDQGRTKIKHLDFIQSSIIQYEKRGARSAVLFEQFWLDQMNGYWIALSADSEDSWKYYYSELGREADLMVKPESRLNLWKDDSTLQIELIRIKPEFSKWFGFYSPHAAKRKDLVEDSLAYTITVRELKRDSDGDGLTDIVEEKLWTNPQSSDTDGDGIPDGIDMNPRFPPLGKPSPTQLVYELLIDNSIAHTELFRDLVQYSIEDYVKARNHPAGAPQFDDSPIHRTIMIVSDDPHVRFVSPAYVRVIVLAPDEYRIYHRQHPSTLPNYYLTPLYRCLDKRFSAAVSYGDADWNAQYIVNIDSWTVRMLGVQTVDYVGDRWVEPSSSW